MTLPGIRFTPPSPKVVRGFNAVFNVSGNQLWHKHAVELSIMTMTPMWRQCNCVFDIFDHVSVVSFHEPKIVCIATYAAHPSVPLFSCQIWWISFLKLHVLNNNLNVFAYNIMKYLTGGYAYKTHYRKYAHIRKPYYTISQRRRINTQLLKVSSIENIK